MENRKFPNLFIIGAMKSATSSLHECLDRHPQLYMSRFKEPQYFAPHRTPEGYLWGQGNPYPEPGEEWYIRLFEEAGDVKYAGESSTAYTRRPMNEGVADRIHAYCPEAKLIYVMRDPVERALSHYRYNVANLREGRPLMKALRDDRQYIDHSRYDFQLDPYLQRFESAQLYLTTMEELVSSPRETMQSLLSWLGVQAIDLGPLPKANVTDGSKDRVRPSCHRVAFWLRHRTSQAVFRRLPTFAQTFARWMITTSSDNDGASESQVSEAIGYLRNELQPSVERLSRLSGRTYDSWRHFLPNRTHSAKDK